MAFLLGILKQRPSKTVALRDVSKINTIELKYGYRACIFSRIKDNFQGK